MKRFLSGLLAVSFLLSGCARAEGSPAGTQASPPQDEAAGETMCDLVLAQGDAVLGDGRSVTVRLILREGVFLSGEQVAPGGGLGEENYQGVCEVQVLADGEALSSLVLEGDGREELLFSDTSLPFALRFADYNGDGNPDFTIGQWAGSTADCYTLFTIAPDGTVTPQSAPYAIFASDGKEDQNEYCAVFEREGNGFIARFYNNATGEYERIPYRWDAAKNTYLEDQGGKTDD